MDITEILRDHEAETKIPNVLKRRLKFIEHRFNASANGLSFKPLNKKLSFWIASNGDTFFIVRNFKNNAYSIRQHTTAANKVYRVKGKLSLEENLMFNALKLEDGSYISRAKLVAAKFCDNENNYQYVSFADGNPENINARNLYWSKENLFPEQNKILQPIHNELTIMPESFTMLREKTLTDSSFGQSTTPYKIRLPNDLISWLSNWKITPTIAATNGIRVMAKWSFTVYAIECEATKEVFVGYEPFMESVFFDVILKLSDKVPWVKKVVFDEGYHALKVRYLSTSQTRTSAYNTLSWFMNEYTRNGWQVQNDDWNRGNIKKQVVFEMTQAEYEELNKKANEKYEMSFEQFMKRKIKGLKK